ncbi:MAG: FAD-dependent oxidoreductase [Parcubacteria group bacterium]
MNKYDAIIIGGSCAGLTAGIYTGRRLLKTLIISKDIGGQAAMTFEIENYPGVDKTTGPELMKKMQAQAERFGAEIKIGEATAVEKNKGGFIVKSSVGDFESTAVILAFGLGHKTLSVPGEKELTGRGVAYCATCDAPFFKNKTTGVVGGANSAFETAEYLSSICKKVYIFNRSGELKAEKALVDRVSKAENVEIILNANIEKINGAKKVESVDIDIKGEKKNIALDGLFIDIGWSPNTEFVKDLVKTDESGFIVIDNENKTSVQGIFAAGDVTTVPFKQTVIAAGEGAKAGISAGKWIKKKE